VDEELSRRSERRASTRHRHALHNVNWFIVVAYTSSRAQLHRAFAMRGHGYESAVVRLAHTIIHESRSRGCFYRTRATTSFPYFTYGPPFASCASFDASFTCQLSLSLALSLSLSLSLSLFLWWRYSCLSVRRCQAERFAILERERNREYNLGISERARCNGMSITQSWEDYGIETPGGKAQCQSALHFVPVSTESVTRDVVFAAFPRKVWRPRARRRRR